MANPMLWTSIASVIVHLPAALKNLRDLAKSQGADADDLYKQVIADIDAIGEAVAYMQAWKQAHELFQTLLDGYQDIWTAAVKLGKRDALAFTAQCRDSWLQCSTNLLPQIYTSFSSEQVEIVRVMDIDGGPKDWMALLRGHWDSANKNLNASKPDCEGFWQDCSLIQYYARQCLGRANRNLIESIQCFSEHWTALERGLLSA